MQLIEIKDLYKIYNLGDAEIRALGRREHHDR